MTYNFCTLFDRNYLYRGLALYNSILRHCNNFKLWVLCMDEKTFEILQKMNLTNVELIRLSEIENTELLSVKKTRTPAEYSWTCKSFLLSFIFENNKNLETLSYLDSDLYFFDSPNKIYEEFENNSIMITPHRFRNGRRHWWEKIRGVHNAGLIMFKNDEVAKKCLNWWKGECLNWCFQRYEKGKMGDQMYLDQWSKKFKGVHDIENVGINLGPWNLAKYNIKAKSKGILVNNCPLILFHFHALKIFSSSSFKPALGYYVSKNILNTIYNPYYAELKKTISYVKSIDENFNFGFSEELHFCEKIKNFISKILQ